LTDSGEANLTVERQLASNHGARIPEEGMCGKQRSDV
jgi:hypothetical protein